MLTILILLSYLIFRKISVEGFKRVKTSGVFISIGDSCNVKKQIDINILPAATLFFDWLLTDMDSVNKVLDCNDISDILYYDNIIDLNDPKIQVPTKHSVKIKSLSKCISIHDLPYNPSVKDTDDMIAKYKRRYYRIIDHIKSDKELFFVRNGLISPKEKSEFISIIKKINPSCKFKLVELINNNTVDSYFVNEHNFMSLNLYNYKIEDIDDKDWTSSYWDWNSIFKQID